MNQIFDIADSNLILTDAQTGLNDFSMNESFAKKLDKLSKTVTGFATTIQEKATAIRDKIDKAIDTKENLREMICTGEVLDWYKKSDVAQKQTKIKRFKRSQEFSVKIEHLDSSSEDESPEPGEVDGKFQYPKQNKNPAECHNFSCEQWCSIFRDENELRNHDSNHKMEFYHCLQCLKIFWSMRSFENHNKSHSLEYTYDICKKTFPLKTSLANHKQVHSTELMHCSYDNCNKAFKHRQNQLEHIQWGHRDKKECPCTVCGKLFQLPSVMRGHRIRQHGHIVDLIPGHPGKYNSQSHATTASKSSSTPGNPKPKPQPNRRPVSTPNKT